jgi:NAD(P)-dependent dehydrogenase (short-subunit alcohol dehydrogenase family)
VTRTALVTGSSRNIGRALALQFACAGCNVVLNARSAEGLEPVAAEVRAAGGEALVGAADVRVGAAVSDVVARATEAFGGVDVLVNNAVVRAHTPIEEMQDEDWQRVLDVALTGAFNTIRAVLPGMRARGWGRIVNMAGVAGQKGAANRAGVATAKAGLIGLTKAVAHETAADGITVNAISPGMIATDRRHVTDGSPLAAEHYERETAQTPVGRMGTTEEIAGTCLFLCSDAAAYITGQTVAVNGGLYM